MRAFNFRQVNWEAKGKNENIQDIKLGLDKIDDQVRQGGIVGVW